MVRTLDIIEPNLRGPGGHYASFVYALASRAGDLPARIRIYAHPDADDLLKKYPHIEFPETGKGVDRLLGEWRALFFQMRKARHTLVLTASAKHALICSLLSLLGGRDPEHLRLYFHWKETSCMQKLMHRLSGRVRRYAVAVTPLPSIAKQLRQYGWKHVHCLPYPMVGPSLKFDSLRFEKVMMGGAARLNKGLPLVVELAERWACDAARETPLHIQVSTKHHGRHGHKERGLVERLIACEYSFLSLNHSAPGREAYHDAFSGALVLAPYDREHFADGVSGVVLDALLCGCPVIATEGTWAASLVQRFGAGLVLEGYNVDSLEQAIDHCIADWDNFRSRAIEASKVLRIEHDPSRLLRLACGAD